MSLHSEMGYRRSFWSRFSQAFEEPELSEASKDRREAIIWPDRPVSDIVYAIDGDYYITDEKTADPCKDEEISDVIQELIIDPLNRQTKKVLQGVTLEDMEEEYLKHNEEEYMYYI